MISTFEQDFVTAVSSSNQKGDLMSLLAKKQTQEPLYPYAVFALGGIMVSSNEFEEVKEGLDLMRKAFSVAKNAGTVTPSMRITLKACEKDASARFGIKPPSIFERLFR